MHVLTSYKVDQVAILHLNAKTRTLGTKGAVQGIGWQLLKKDMEESIADYDLFMVTKQLWHAQNKDAKPRQASYKLNYKKDADI